MALALGVSSVRIAPVPGKISVVGIEVPNKVVIPVPIREVLDSPAFRRHKSSVAFSVGKDIGGNYIVGDCSKLPQCSLPAPQGLVSRCALTPCSSVCSINPPRRNSA